MTSPAHGKTGRITLPAKFDRKQKMVCPVDDQSFKNYASLTTHWRKFHRDTNWDLTRANNNDDDDPLISETDDLREEVKQPPSPLEKLAKVAVEEQQQKEAVPPAMESFSNHIRETMRRLNEYGAANVNILPVLSEQELERELQSAVGRTQNIVDLNDACTTYVAKIMKDLSDISSLCAKTLTERQTEIGKIVMEQDKRKRKREDDVDDDDDE